ncbi:MAG: dephospho-CoA kinase [Alphaproteobacteria bacterium]|nr:dephospho-CoA kinase [Alphaproteobacteria bacterium]
MIVAGLTGSIGMGKSTAAAALRHLGCPVHEADKVVHRLMEKGGEAAPLVATAFSDAVPEVIKHGTVDRAALGEFVFGNDEALDRLEAILHPLVRDDEESFLFRMAMRREKLVFLDIPLLFETDAEERLDATVLVTAPPFVQAARVLRRPGMTKARLAAVLSRQMPDAEKKRHADFVIQTGLSRGWTLRQLKQTVRLILQEFGRESENL